MRTLFVYLRSVARWIRGCGYLSVLAASALVAVASQAWGANVEIEGLKTLLAAPLWARTDGAGDDLEKLRTAADTVARLSTTELKETLVAYLDADRDNVELSYRLDNARIVCFLAFELPWSHPFAAYFDKSERSSLRILRPALLDHVNRNRIDRTDLTRFVSQLEEIEKCYPHRPQS